ncbi:hypothetical protein HMPREF0381_1830 [Lachnoanaerobaculum saburreum DSM 3986]|uniref:Uncharacterized protein n=1 Tax=Lachnoanaerobaculum saburreum DSM 3986 TaxID=887325 RepID=E6LPE5_9FIRM|nr:hypothetical protein HMPREF0381_1830 [Lachnoanaerobaculum saburreum DSM 3986]
MQGTLIIYQQSYNLSTIIFCLFLKKFIENFYISIIIKVISK